MYELPEDELQSERQSERQGYKTVTYFDTREWKFKTKTLHFDTTQSKVDYITEQFINLLYRDESE